MFKIQTLALAFSGRCLCPPLRADAAEDKAVVFVKELGGTVTRDQNVPGKPITTVHLDGTQVTDAGQKKLAGLKNLNTLFLQDTKVTDVGLTELAPLQNLNTLDLSNTDVTDTGLKELAPLQNLTTLNLYGTSDAPPRPCTGGALRSAECAGR